MALPQESLRRFRPLFVLLSVGRLRGFYDCGSAGNWPAKASSEIGFTWAGHFAVLQGLG